jgi:hypothetical protein
MLFSAVMTCCALIEEEVLARECASKRIVGVRRK